MHWQSSVRGRNNLSKSNYELQKADFWQPWDPTHCLPDINANCSGLGGSTRIQPKWASTNEQEISAMYAGTGGKTEIIAQWWRFPVGGTKENTNSMSGSGVSR